MLYTGKRVIASRGDAAGNWKLYQLVLCLFTGMSAGMVGGLLGLGGGFILGPLFLELGIPPQVSLPWMFDYYRLCVGFALRILSLMWTNQPLICPALCVINIANN